MATSFYPLSPKEELLKQFLGKSIKDVPTPAAVLDLNKLKVNCSRMLEACKSLGFGWRAHIKTHKTTELTRLQVGDGSGPANIIVSTVLEAENIVPLLLEYKSKGRLISLLLAFPVTPSVVPRLANVAKTIGPHGLSVFVDHPAQLSCVVSIHKLSGIAPDIFIKIDMGYGRAGIPPDSPTAFSLVTSLLELSSSGTANLLGLYAHGGQSYAGSSRTEALTLLNQEFTSLLQASELVQSISPNHPLVLSVGATPTSSSIRNLLVSPQSLSPSETSAVTTLQSTIEAIRATNSSIEIHAGVYPVLDMQQLSTNALPTEGPEALLSYSDLALTIVAEIASVYPNRGVNDTTEYLLRAGSLALGREPCKSYPGWGVLTPWNRKSAVMPTGKVDDLEGWIVGRISQEHGIVTFQGEGKGKDGVGEREEFEVGQKVRVWPNHACIVGAGYGWYFVVDGSLEGREDEVVDVWVRWRGW